MDVPCSSVKLFLLVRLCFSVVLLIPSKLQLARTRTDVLSWNASLAQCQGRIMVTAKNTGISMQTRVRQLKTRDGQKAILLKKIQAQIFFNFPRESRSKKLKTNPRLVFSIQQKLSELSAKPRPSWCPKASRRWGNVLLLRVANHEVARYQW